MSEIKDRLEYEKCVALANEWMSAYYAKDAPLASDAEYDLLIRKIRKFESENADLINKNSPTQKIAPVIQSEFKKLAHIEKMWSMEDVFNEDELRAWSKRAKCENDFFIEPKFDGASLNLLYENGRLISGATRGDGELGEDISLNVLAISSIPKAIPYKEKIEIRGEIVILKADFEKINNERLQNNQSLFSNPRNAASGSLRQLDTSITKQRNLKFYPWGLGFNTLNFTKHSEEMKFVRSLGFLSDDFVRLASNLDEVMSSYKELILLREKKPMMIDGMVVRIDDLATCKNLGYTVKFPKFMAAFKFPAQEKTTRLKNVILQVGRSGVITPVAELEAVEIDGAMIKNATLHNFDEIARLDLKINDFVGIIRSGDVIPKITSVFKNRRNGDEREITRPKLCPVCNQSLLDEGALIKCQNMSCSARALNSIIYFASKKCLNIDGLGESIITLLFKENKISNALDIFKLSNDDFAGLEGFKEKKISNLLNAIKMAKNCSLARFINALGIEHIGEVASKKLANAFSLAWCEKSYEEYASLEGFGGEMAMSLVEFCAVNKEKIKEFSEILNLELPSLNENLNQISNKSFVITGTLSKPREYFIEIIENLGAKVSSSVSKKTSFVLYGENAGSKLEKAKELNVKLLNEDEFNELVNAL